MRIEIKYAIGIAAFSLLWLVLEMSVGLHDTLIRYHPYVTWIGMTIPVIGIRLALDEKRETVDYVMPFMAGLKSGLIITAIMAVLSVPTQYVFHEFINPDFFTNAIEAAVRYYMSEGKDEATARAMAESTFNLNSYMLQSFLGTLIFGIVISAVMAYFMRTKDAAAS